MRRAKTPSAMKRTQTIRQNIRKDEPRKANLKLISWNINGLRAAESKGAFEWLKGSDVDFVGLQEIKSKPEQIPASVYNLGFSQIDVNSATRAGYSGVASLAKFENVAKKCEFFDDDEGRILEHRFDDVVLFNIYFPNGQQSEERLAYKMDFYAKFLAYAKALARSGLGVIFCGDVNTAHREIDLAHPKANEKTSGFLPIERAWIDEVIASGFVDTYRAVHGDKKDVYSWWSYRMRARERNVGWRIDYFFISANLRPRLKDAFVLSEIAGSDHCPVGIEIDL